VQISEMLCTTSSVLDKCAFVCMGGNFHRYISGYTWLAYTWPSCQFTFCLHW